LQNIRASNKLYEEGYYPEAIFFLQQAMEKGCKSFGFFFGVIDKNEAWKKQAIGHTGTRVYDYTLEDFDKILEYNIKGLSFLQVMAAKYDIIESEPDINKLQDFTNIFENVQNKLDELSNNPTRFSKASYKHLNDELNDTTRLMQQIETLECQFNNLNNNDVVKLTQNALDQFIAPTRRRIFVLERTDLYHEALKADRKIKLIVEDLDDPNKSKTIGRYLMKELVAINPILQVAYITQPHESSTRYYFNGKSPDDRYCKDHTLVKLYPNLYTIGEKGLNNLNDLYYKYRKFSYIIKRLDTIINFND
jgi:hypothetical protein